MSDWIVLRHYSVV